MAEILAIIIAILIVFGIPSIVLIVIGVLVGLFISWLFKRKKSKVKNNSFKSVKKFRSTPKLYENYLDKHKIEPYDTK